MKKLTMVLLVCAALLPRPAAALATKDLLALVAMPLAVAAVSEVTDVPVNELVDFVSLLNQADVPPAQFVEVVRYVPVALVVQNDEPNFVEFVRTRTQTGVSGATLVTVIQDRYQTMYSLPATQFQTTMPSTVFEDEANFVPPVVRIRLAEVKRHPHAGPPGLLKKQQGLQTGAEIVHVKPKKHERQQEVRVMVVAPEQRVVRPARVKIERADHGKGGRGNDGGHPKGEHGGGNGKGHGKGKGKG
jgi:hypothetical protein